MDHGPPVRLTIDVNIARDYFQPWRSRHGNAVELFRLHREGVVELAAAPQGYRSDVKDDLEAGSGMLESEGVKTLRQVARLWG